METTPTRLDRSPLQRRVILGLTLLAILWGAYQTLDNAPPSRERPRGLAWLPRYAALSEPLAGVDSAIYLNAPGVKGKFRFFRAQYVLTPTTLILRSKPDRFLTGDWPARPLILDYQRQAHLLPVLADFRDRAAELGIEIEIQEHGKGLALIRSLEGR